MQKLSPGPASTTFIYFFVTNISLVYIGNIDVVIINGLGSQLVLFPKCLKCNDMRCLLHVAGVAKVHPSL